MDKVKIKLTHVALHNLEVVLNVDTKDMTNTERIKLKKMQIKIHQMQLKWLEKKNNFHNNYDNVSLRALYRDGITVSFEKENDQWLANLVKDFCSSEKSGAVSIIQSELFKLVTELGDFSLPKIKYLK